MPEKKTLKRDYPQFESLEVDDWQHYGIKQPALTKSFCELEPVQKITEQPVQLDFLLNDLENVWIFEENTYFRISGQFQSRSKPEGKDWDPWAGVEAADASNFILQPNWMDGLIKGVETYHGYNKINTSEELGLVGGYLNTWKYAYMDKEQKRKLCFQPCHPGNAVPTSKNQWTYGNDKEWNKYAKTILLGATGKVSFNWIRLDYFPFFQGCNYANGSKVLPMPNLNGLTIRFLFSDHPEYIFNKKAGNTKEYRFIFEKFTLCYEKMQLSDPFRKMFLDKKEINYPGVTRLMRQETIPATNTTYISTIQEVGFPEGVVIFFIPKEVLAGTYKYQSNTTGNVFLNHNIQNIKFSYGRKNFFTATPDIGVINIDQMEFKLITDLWNQPPFGMTIDKDKITEDLIKDGWKDSPYPHVYLNLCLDKSKDRYIPLYDKGEVLAKNASKKYENLELTFTFKTGGAPADATMIIYLFYTDSYITLDMHRKGAAFFASNYIQMH